MPTHSQLQYNKTSRGHSSDAVACIYFRRQ